MAREMERDLLISVARTALRTKVAQKLADQLSEVGSSCVQLTCHPVLCLYYSPVFLIMHTSALALVLARPQYPLSSPG